MNIIGRVPGHCDATRFRRMFELTMTANSGDECPTIISEKLEYITNFHGAHMIGESVDKEKPYNV